ncbi:exodeoxyribonuclease VII small subunit [Lysinibacillus endophyticus]|uniref:Exodeoxyribonuclease 7 small subunit n=1 Tax=Ureibacillus endophyticus TaxID=1978490 RepID=A0A494Z0B2_9BACL|nr:exodeoxyribonuclease VII small subunit [Lysinibacillus endophyticus]MCP1145184.1 exodeoxyribonuclease VII small subunit [Lysinibacillus endophyticus]RKQ15954.1 exodeoxyribonuclease VII small subunit [Lysinibacillus endophyticus]
MGNEQKFADAMQELEEIVRKLEQGDVQLEEAIDLYKKGMELSHFCHDKLQNAEKQLISIVNENGEKQNFEPINNGVDNN